ncbi:cytidylate kinase [Hydrogenispora ethanolica]|uniref:Cytidylate kinase n=1 Tax=Hydrogenispora ethanolica TaxID=1082276 RepID=A0A4R1QWX0_HYDET|nr:AAA family ATPase [Hydrogenispora ethanolica]TCL57455.1 cytidylate kinase [Hydrogenispora ethanolica]
MTDANFKIAVSGDLGSGKSTVCKLLLEKLPGFRIFSMGEAWRKLAEDRGMTILELNQYSETHPLDEEMDEAMAKMGKAEEQIIFDSRLGWHFVPHSFKVHLTVDPRAAASRIFNDRRRGDAEEYASVDEAMQKILERHQSEKQRYLQKYGIDCTNPANYHLIIDTTHQTPEAVAESIIGRFRSWAEQQ